MHSTSLSLVLWEQTWQLNQKSVFLWSKHWQSLIHSFPKETQHFWSCVSFGEECIRVNHIFGCSFLKGSGTVSMQISHDPRLHDPDPGPQEKSTEKSCVSFGKDCTITLPEQAYFYRGSIWKDYLLILWHVVSPNWNNQDSDLFVVLMWLHYSSRVMVRH